jgi:hypothetical protein
MYYETKHKGQYDCYTGKLRNYKINSVKSSSWQQQNIFQGYCNETKTGVCASYKVAEQLPKKW